MITTTLNTILCHDPCGQDPADGTGWWLLLNTVGKTQADDEPLALLTILDSNGLDDCLWALHCLGPEHEHWVRLFARECASDVLHLWDAPQVVKDYLATGDESIRTAAWTAAWTAAGAAAGDAARAAAWTAARAAEGAAARAAARAAAWAAAGAAEGDAAWTAARDKQNARLRAYLEADGCVTDRAGEPLCRPAR